MKNFVFAIGDVNFFVVKPFALADPLRKRGPIVEKSDYFRVNLIDLFSESIDRLFTAQ
jgi:hypothetical protein